MFGVVFCLKIIIHYILLNDKATIKLSKLDIWWFWWSRCKSEPRNMGFPL